MDIFDIVGNLVVVGKFVGLEDSEGNIFNLDKVLFVDFIGIFVFFILGIFEIIFYVEFIIGVEVGVKIGFLFVVVVLLFLLFLVLFLIFNIFIYFFVIFGVFVLVGVLMF